MNNNSDYAALILRIALGAMFVSHGLLKLLVFTLPGTAGFFEQVGFPGWTAYIVTFAEIGGGVLLIGGVAVRARAVLVERSGGRVLARREPHPDFGLLLLLRGTGAG